MGTSSVRWAGSLWLVGGLLWLAGLAWGVHVIAAYASTPGIPAQVEVGPSAHPAPAGKSGKYHLVMLAHPRCACTRASLGELARVMARCGDRIEATVWFYMPGEQTWNKSDLWSTAASIPGVAVRWDRDGEAARQFGAFISGQVLLYEPAGQRVFSGGITFARGHAGDNAGAEAVVALVKGSAEPQDAGSTRKTSVFGCELFGPDPAVAR